MSMDKLKDNAFRYFDKVAFAVVVLFVVWKVLLAPADQPIGGGGGGDGGKVDVPKPPTSVIPSVTSAWTKVPEPHRPPYDPYFPQRVVYLQAVRLEMPTKTEGVEAPKEEPKTTMVRELSAKLVGELRDWPLTEALLRQIDPFRARTMALNPDLKLPPCQVSWTADATGKKLTFEAKAPGDWIGFEGVLDNENKVRVAVHVREGDIVIPIDVLGATDVKVEEEQLGHVVVRWVNELPSRTVTTKKQKDYIPAAYFKVYRQAEGEAEPRPIGRVQGTGKSVRLGPAGGRDARDDAMMRERMMGDGEEMMMPPPVRPDRRRIPGMPPAMPGRMTPEEAMEGGMPPVPPGRGGIPADRMRDYGGYDLPPDRRRQPEFDPGRTARQGEFVYVDNSVESEVKYTYWVEAVVLLENPPQTLTEYASSKPDARDKPGPGYTILTHQKFSFAYVGHRVRDGAMVANIIVFIGPRDNPLESRPFEVYPGGYIGDAPGVTPVEDEKKPEEGAGLAANVAAAPDVRRLAPPVEDEESAQNYVTRFVLVDIVPLAQRLLVDKVPVAIEGKMVKVDNYMYVPKPKIIVRDRKNRLIELWHESAPKLEKKPREPRGRDPRGRDPRGRGPVDRRRLPPEAYEGMTPEEAMEMGEGMPPVRPGRPVRPRPRR